MKTPTKQALASLARDFASLVKKHNLTCSRFYPIDGEPTHLMLSDGRVLIYHQPEATWTEFASIDKRFAISSRNLAKAVSRVGKAAQDATPGIVKLTKLVKQL